jgi:hypothetical protein
MKSAGVNHNHTSTEPTIGDSMASWTAKIGGLDGKNNEERTDLEGTVERREDKESQETMQERSQTNLQKRRGRI